MDPRLYSLSILPTGEKLLAGEVHGVLRVSNLARLLGVPLADRGALIDWVSESDLWIEPPYHDLALLPLAGCMKAEQVAAALRKDLKRLPFRCEQLEGCS
jgi:hypothetical protein